MPPHFIRGLRCLLAFLGTGAGLLAQQSADYRKVVIAMVNSETQEPIQGVKITARYFGDDKIIASLNAVQKTETTGADGKVEILVYKDALDEAKIGRVDMAYQWYFKDNFLESRASIPRSPDKATRYLFERPVNVSPDKPDFVFDITDRALDKKLREIDERDERLADTWLKTRPDFWPDSEPAGKTASAELKLVSKRWVLAKPEPRDSADTKTIEKLVLAHIPQPDPGIAGIRRVGPDVAMVIGTWRGGSGGLLCRYFVARKTGNQWSIIRRYWSASTTPFVATQKAEGAEND